MSDEIEVETKELQETIEELHEERKEREEEARKSSWTRYVALTTAILAAIGALQSGSLVNEAMILQLKAADTWNEYQADKQKDHLYTTLADSLLDNGARLPARSGSAGGRRAAAGRANPAPKVTGPTATVPESAKPTGGSVKSGPIRWKALSPDDRLAQYVKEEAKEASKEDELQKEAARLERESEDRMHGHHRFAASVALMQVAIALGAVASLTKMKSVWGVSMVVGAAGIVFFILGALAF